MHIDLDFYIPLGAWGGYFAGLQSIEVRQKDVAPRPNGCDMGDHVPRGTYLNSAGDSQGTHEIRRQ